jgi:hypothetical protein
MNADSVIAISALVVALSQLIKWAIPNDRMSGMAALLIVAMLSAVGVGAWVFSLSTSVDKTWTFGILSAWVAVMLTSAGVFGFVNTATGRPSGNRVD